MTGEVIQTDDGKTVATAEQQQLLLTVQQRIGEVEKMLLAKDPALPGHLKEIHRYLIQFEELAHLLTDDDIRNLIRVQKQYTGTVLIASIAKTSKASITKQAKGITAADL